MLEHWIQPPADHNSLVEYLDADRLGKHLSVLTDIERPPQKRELALIGSDARWSKAVRRHLYQFGYRMSDIIMYDLGDLRKKDPDFVVGPMIELLSSGICPVLIGGYAGLLKSLQQSFAQMGSSCRPVIVHERIPETLMSSENNANVLGVQQHLIPRQIPSHIHVMHLSEVTRQPGNAEPMIRESNCMLFDLAAMAMSEMPAQRSFSSSGLTTTDACLLTRFAGLHADTRALVISGHDPMSLQLDMSANTAAQLIWYFAEAYNQCIIEHPLNNSQCTSYTVHLDQYSTSFKFFKSERTGRWWVQLRTGNTPEPVFPCTYQDYLCATSGEVSDRLIACTNTSLEGSQQRL